MFIVLQNTNRTGASWVLTEQPLVIGRSEGCDIRVIDPSISRKHLQVWELEGQPHFQDLGSSNAIFVNGSPAHAGVLYEGDTLAVGSTLFKILRVAPARQVTPANDQATPITLSVARGLYTQDINETRLLKASPRNIHELHDLFQLGRSLAALESVADLIDLLRQLLQGQFQPLDSWIALRYAEADALFFQNKNGSGAIPAVASELLDRALDAREGIISTGLHRANGERQPETWLAVPFVHADRPLGGFVLHGRVPSRLYAEDDLHYALGIAAITAPHLRAVQHAEQLRRENRLLSGETGHTYQLLGDSPIMEQLREKIRRAANTRLNTLLLGETGTGKEIAARLLHSWGPRADGPFIIINCAAIPGELFESELFGHEKGAFTGAAQQRIGRLEEADGGTLFLDEIGDLAPDNQARMLRAIETGNFRRVGGSKPIQVDVRFVSATNKTLTEPNFRLDLLHRLNGITLHLPPLRAHPADIPLLANHFLDLSNQTGAQQHIADIAPDALQHLQSYPWPGNVRELRTTIQRAAAFTQQSCLTREDFEFASKSDSEVHIQNVSEMHNRDTILLISLAEAERRHIQSVLTACDNNVSAAARVLGIARWTIYKRLNPQI